MALLTKQAVDEQIQESFSALIDLSDKYNVQTMKMDIKQQIENLQQQEALFLKAVNADSIETVNQRIKQYKEASPKIQNLNGINLYWEFLNSIESSQKYLDDKEQKEFVDFFSRVDVQGLTEGITQEENFQNWFQSILNSVSTGTVSSTKGYEKATGIEQVVFKRLTAQQKRRAREFMKGKRKDKQKYQITVLEQPKSVLTTLTKQDWASLTQNQKKSEIEEQIKSGLINQEQLDNMLTEIYNLIVSKGPSENPIFCQAVREVIFEKNSKTKVFYSGNMLNGITGLLGEIQGLFFMKCLLGEANSKASISWIGGINNPHEDLILQTMGQQVGIQIKNSYKDLEKIKTLEDISFMNRAANSFEIVKQKLGASDYQDILSIYEMDAFNIEYIYENGEYIARTNEKFAQSRSNIRFLAREADRIMALFAGALMYMAVGENFSSIELGNSVYILGGATIKLASEILINLFQKLENYEKDFGFKITSYFEKGASKVSNIVDYLNSNKSKHGGSVRKSLGQLFLQSSYSFDL